MQHKENLLEVNNYETNSNYKSGKKDSGWEKGINYEYKLSVHAHMQYKIWIMLHKIIDVLPSTFINKNNITYAVLYTLILIPSCLNQCLCDLLNVKTDSDRCIPGVAVKSS